MLEMQRLSAARSFDMNNTRFFDTGSIGHMASRAMLPGNEGEPLPHPCAIAGAYMNNPALQLSTIAAGVQYPLVATRATNIRVLQPEFSPFSSQLYPNAFAVSDIVVEYLWHRGRTNYIAILYPSTDYGIQQRETLGVALEKRHMEWDFFHYLAPDLPSRANSDCILTAMQRAKDRRFRTIIFSMEHPDLELQAIAEAAEELGMTNGDFFYLLYGDFNPEPMYNTTPTLITKLLYGSVWIIGIEESMLQFRTSPLYQSITTLGPDFVNRLNTFNPIQPGETGYYYAEPDYFTSASRASSKQ